SLFRSLTSRGKQIVVPLYVYIPELLQNSDPTLEVLNEDNFIVDVLTMKDATYTLSISIRRDIHVPTKLELSGAENVSVFYNDYIATTTQQYYPQNYIIEMKPRTHGPTQTLITNLSEVVLNQSFKDSDFSLKTQISNGNRVVMDDRPQIEYIWMDGEIVLKTDERMLAIARQGHKFIPGKEEPRFWLIIVGVLLVLIGGGINLHRFLISKKKHESS
ncbi:MAG: hypothetical protein Q4C95_13055, partial [Planctomycetia bacterium]|nr:hypothetical protein [Planctomycetia bacterium]